MMVFQLREDDFERSLSSIGRDQLRLLLETGRCGGRRECRGLTEPEIALARSHLPWAGRVLRQISKIF